LWEVQSYVVEEVSSAAEPRGISFALEGSHAPAQSDRELVRRMAHYMALQAIRLVEDGQTIGIAVNENNGKACMSLRIPRAITPAEGMLLFDAFSGTEDPDRCHDLGMELYVARVIARHLGGDVILSSDHDWSTIEARLPLSKGTPDEHHDVAIIGGTGSERREVQTQLRRMMPTAKLVAARTDVEIHSILKDSPFLVFCLGSNDTMWPRAQHVSLSGSDAATVAAAWERLNLPPTGSDENAAPDNTHQSAPEAGGDLSPGDSSESSGTSGPLDSEREHGLESTDRRQHDSHIRHD
jgi:hypothetical protein